METTISTMNSYNDVILTPRERVHSSKSIKSNMKLVGKQILILLWKCLMIRKFHYLSTFFELIGPILLFIAISKLKKITPDDSDRSVQSTFLFENNDIIDTGKTIYSFSYEIDFINPTSKQEISRIYFTPNNNFYRQLFKSLKLTHRNLELLSFDNELELIKQMKNDLPKNMSTTFPFYLGVVFKNTDLNHEGLDYKMIIGTTSLDYSQFNNFHFKLDKKPVNFHFDYNYNKQLSILTSHINRQYLLNVTRDFKLDKITLKRMPYPSFEEKKTSIQNLIYQLLPFFISTVYILVCPLIVKRITDEKSTKAKELLKMIGMSDYVFWITHFLNYLIIILVHSIAFAFIFTGNGTIFPRSSTFLSFFIFLLFGMQLILFFMLLSTFFNRYLNYLFLFKFKFNFFNSRPVFSVIMAIILWVILTNVILNSLSPMVNQSSLGNNDFFKRIFSSFLPVGSLFWFISIMDYLERHDDGLSLFTLNKSSTNFGDFTMLLNVIMILISYPIYAFLIWYIDNIWPFQYGIPKSPFFIFKYFCKRKENELEFETPRSNTERFEPEPKNLMPIIRIQKVSKYFNSNYMGKKFAVNNLSLNIYENQITVLIGHNGAGKTTTMNMITGIYSSSSGKIFVNDYNVFEETELARRSIGLCPQENIFFKELTVYQHLKLFAVLKNCRKNITKEVYRMLELLKLSDKSNQLAIKLSGGMKRRLQLAMALIGDTEILILDEPTSGLDPEARRAVWDLLISLRRERTILLTTHDMEEADVRIFLLIFKLKILLFRFLEIVSQL